MFVLDRETLGTRSMTELEMTDRGLHNPTVEWLGFSCIVRAESET